MSPALLPPSLQNFVESGYDWNVLYGEGYTAESDPFYDPPTQRLSGSASVYLDPICYMLDIKENTPILDYKVGCCPGYRVALSSC